MLCSILLSSSKCVFVRAVLPVIMLHLNSATAMACGIVYSWIFSIQLHKCVCMVHWLLSPWLFEDPGAFASLMLEHCLKNLGRRFRVMFAMYTTRA